MAFFGGSQSSVNEGDPAGSTGAVPPSQKHGQQQHQHEVEEGSAGREDEQAVARLVDEAADVGVIDILLTYPLMPACRSVIILCTVLCSSRCIACDAVTAALLRVPRYLVLSLLGNSRFSCLT